jgi:hypothetical protein
MATNTPKPFTRLTLPDPSANFALQDVYDKLNSLQSAIAILQAGTPAASTAPTAATTGMNAPGGVSGQLQVNDGAGGFAGGDLSGDVTTNGGTLATLPATGVSAGSYGDSTHVGQFTVNAKGLLTAAASVAISGGGSPVTSVFGRTGAVTAQTGDYTYAQISGAPWVVASPGIYYSSGQVGIGTPAIATAELTIQPPLLTTTTGFNVYQELHGTSSHTIPGNEIYINGDDMAAGFGPFNSQSQALQIQHVFGGSNMTGGRTSLEVDSYLIAPSSTSNIYHDYIGLQVNMICDSGDNGSISAYHGGIFGANITSEAQNGATFLEGVVGMELNWALVAGCSALLNTGLSLVPGGNNAVRGSLLDAALNFGSVGGSTPLFLMILTDVHGAAPLDSSGTILGTDGNAHTVLSGIDLSSYTFTNYFLKSQGFSVNGSGATIVASVEFPDTTVQTTAASQISVQSVVTGSRALSTVYQNTTGKPMFVNISVSNVTIGTAYSDSATNPTTAVDNAAYSGTPIVSFHFWVLPSNYYKLVITGSSPAIQIWIEWH